MMRNRLIAVAGGLTAALLFLAPSLGTGGTLMLSLFNPLPLMLVGLGLGRVNALIAAASAMAAVMATLGVTPAIHYAEGTLMSALAVIFLALHSRPTPDGGRSWAPAGHVLGGLTIIALAGLVGATLYYLGEDGGLRGVIQRTLEQVLEPILRGMPAADAQTAADAINTTFIAAYVPGFVGAGWMVYLAVNGIAAQGLLTGAGKNVRPAAAFRDLGLPGWMGTAIVVCGVLALIPGEIGFVGKNAVLIMLAPFFLLGLAVIHALVRTWPRRGVALVFLYLAIFILTGLAIAVIATLGIFEQWTQLRRRFAGAGSGHGKEEE